MGVFDELLLGSGVVGFVVFVFLVLAPIGIWFALRRLAKAGEALVKAIDQHGLRQGDIADALRETQREAADTQHLEADP